MKPYIFTAAMFLAGTLMYGQTQPDRVLVLTKTWSDTIDGTWWEALQEIELSPAPAKERTACLRTHNYYCGSRYVDLSVSPLTETKPELLKLLRSSHVCTLEPADVQRSLSGAEFQTTAMSGGSWRIVAECEGHIRVLEIPEWIGIDEKKLQRESSSVASLFKFARLLSADYSASESQCPDEWKTDSTKQLGSLLDSVHSVALEGSSGFSALQQGRVNEPPAGVYSYSVDIDRSLLESSPDAPPRILDEKRGHAEMDLIAIVDSTEGKVIRVEKGPNVSGDILFYWEVRNNASSWKFHPGGPERVPFRVTFRCEQ